MTQGPYRVFRLGAYMRTFPTRDQALRYVMTRDDDPANYEVLDRSDQ